MKVVLVKGHCKLHVAHCLIAFQVVILALSSMHMQSVSSTGSPVIMLRFACGDAVVVQLQQVQVESRRLRNEHVI